MRKTFEIDGETLAALKLFAEDSGRTLDELAGEAFTLLLRKHGRPKGLNEALRFSLRTMPRNDNGADRQKRVR
jgi:hypothetical protein